MKFAAYSRKMFEFLSLELCLLDEFYAQNRSLNRIYVLQYLFSSVPSSLAELFIACRGESKADHRLEPSQHWTNLSSILIPPRAIRQTILWVVSNLLGDFEEPRKITAKHQRTARARVSWVVICEIYAASPKSLWCVAVSTQLELLRKAELPMPRRRRRLFRSEKK